MKALRSMARAKRRAASSAAAPTLIEARFSVPPADDAELIWIESGRSVALSQPAPRCDRWIGPQGRRARLGS